MSWQITGVGGTGLDADAAAYIAAVQAADGQTLEAGVQWNIDQFVRGCKADGIWSAIGASCILAGARSLAGALVPLKGAAPTNNNFATGDYNRKTGLAGNGSTKWLNTNRPFSSETQNNVHIAVYATLRHAGTARYMGSQTTDNRLDLIGNTAGFHARVNSSTLDALGTSTASSVLIGVSRSASDSYSWRYGSQSGVQSTASVGLASGNYAVFAANNGTNLTDARLAFYSIGASLDLALLDARVTNLINALAAAIL